MTDQELIKALRYCGKGIGCARCPASGECHKVSSDYAADRLEALLAENERLKAQMPKWRPVSEPPKEYGEYLCRARSSTKKGECYTATMKYDEYGWKEDDILYTKRVTHWMPIPEPPSTEGVE